MQVISILFYLYKKIGKAGTRMEQRNKQEI